MNFINITAHQCQNWGDLEAFINPSASFGSVSPVTFDALSFGLFKGMNGSCDFLVLKGGLLGWLSFQCIAKSDDSQPTLNEHQSDELACG